MNFGQAIESIKQGKCVRRAGWNGKGMHIYLEDWLEGKAKPCGRSLEPVICMFTAQGKYQPGWLASQSDILAEDWEVV